MSKLFNDEKTYHECAQPFGSREEANKALNTFLDEVYALRVKHKVANVSLIIRDSVADVGAVMASAHFGDALQQEAMAAYYYGRSSAERQEMMGELLQSGAVAAKDKKRK